MSDLIYGEVVSEIEKHVLTEFDPFLHYVMLESMVNGSLPTVTAEGSDGEPVLDHGVVLALARSKERRSTHLRSLARVLRYFASETMIVLLLSGRIFGPFSRLASMLRHDVLNGVFEDISSRRVPRDFAISLEGKSLGFAEWLSFCLCRETEWIELTGNSDLIELIAEEAEMLSARGAINAFKHGKPFSTQLGSRISVQNHETNEWAQINELLQGISWIEWREKGRMFSIGVHTEEISPEQDKARIFVVSMLCNAMRDVRLAELQGEKVVTACFPCDFATGLNVRRQNVTVRFS